MVQRKIMVREPECVIQALVVVFIIFRLKRFKSIAQSNAHFNWNGETYSSGNITDIHPGCILDDRLLYLEVWT